MLAASDLKFKPNEQIQLDCDSGGANNNKLSAICLLGGNWSRPLTCSEENNSEVVKCPPIGGVSDGVMFGSGVQVGAELRQEKCDTNLRKN